MSLIIGAYGLISLLVTVVIYDDPGDPTVPFICGLLALSGAGGDCLGPRPGPRLPGASVPGCGEHAPALHFKQVAVVKRALAAAMVVAVGLGFILLERIDRREQAYRNELLN